MKRGKKILLTIGVWFWKNKDGVKEDGEEKVNADR
jgi:hypothetical protein